jgi:hypothetical protein
MTVLNPRSLCWVIVGLLLAMALVFLLFGDVIGLVVCLVVALGWLRVAFKVTVA